MNAQSIYTNRAEVTHGRAEKRGLLRRTQNPLDGRGVDAALTERGIEFAERGAATVAQAFSPLTKTLSAAEARRLTALLERMLGDR